MKNLKTSISIGISAYNEERNIKKLITSIFSQKKGSYFIQEILILADGDTQETEKIISSMHNPIIKLFTSKIRRGKSSCVNEIFIKAEGDIVILFDADVVIASKSSISNLIKPIVNSKTIALTAGKFCPYPPRNFIEKCVIATRDTYDRVKLTIKDGNNARFCGAKFLAISKNLYKEIRIPKNVTADDTYIYFACLKNGFQFKYVKSAPILFRVPSTLKDQISQNLRYVSQGNKINEIFGEVVDRELYIPKMKLIKSMIYQLIKTPIQTTAIFFINFYIKLIKLTRKLENSNGTWVMSQSTKE